MSSLCRICLAGKVKMHSNISTDLLHLYEKLANTKLNIEDGRPTTLCYICFARLRRCQTFSVMAHRSEKLFTELLNSKIGLTHQAISSLNLNWQYLKVDLQPPLIPLFSEDVYNDGPPKRDNKPETVSIKSEVEHEPFTREFTIKVEPAPDSEKDEDESLNSSNQDWEHTDKPKDKALEAEKGNVKAKKVPRPKIIACRICGRKFAKQDNLNKHFKTHPGMKPYLCELCDDSFFHKKDLLTHKRLHHGNLGHVCKTCGKSFSHKGMYDRHTLTHYGIKPYSCNMCDKQFTLKNNMLRHLRTHTGEKPFVCDTCDRRFAEKKSLEAHISLHHMKERRFSCEKCGQTFEFSRDLKLHTITMHGGRTPFACNLCDSIFSLKQTLKSHMRTHTGEKPYSCDVCHKTFTQSSSLSKHKKIHTRQVEIEIENVFVKMKKTEANKSDIGVKTEFSDTVKIKQEPNS